MCVCLVVSGIHHRKNLRSSYMAIESFREWDLNP